MYHRIDRHTSQLSAVTRPLTVTTSTFAAQMTWLARHHFHPLTQEQVYAGLLAGTPLPPRPVLITFDDGYRDVYTHALPVLRRLHFAATEYVITGRISGADPSFLTWGELRRAEDEGLETGSHTVTHRSLTALSASDARHELLASRIALERHLGHPVQWLAYPYGSVDDGVVAQARSAGYVLAVTTHGGALQDARHPLALHRYEVHGDESLASFAATVTSG
jgi:peptidoglycan/xylan/chitin deacetylase (PgdA/CDA1 family)